MTEKTLPLGNEALRTRTQNMTGPFNSSDEISGSRIKVVCAVPHSYDLSPGQRYRWEQWQGGLRDQGVDLSFLPFCTPEIDRLLRAGQMGRAGLKALERYPSWLLDMKGALEADLLVIPRKAAPAGSFFVERWVTQRARAFVYDFDDAIFLKAPGRSDTAEFFLRATKRCPAHCREADLVLTGNAYLAEYARTQNSHVRVIPTTVNTSLHTPRESAKSLGSPVVVGWIGSRTTAVYLESILPELAEAQRHADFELLVIGAEMNLQGVRGKCEPWSSAAEIGLLQEMDIGLMPLVDSDWERGKCSLKALLYGAVGIPAVVSNVGTNPEAVLDGKTGFLVSESSQWAPRIIELVTDVALRRQFGVAAREHIESNYSTKRWVPELALALRDAAMRGKATSEARRQP